MNNLPRLRFRPELHLLPALPGIFIICESISPSRLRDYYSIYRIPDLYFKKFFKLV